MKSVVILGSTGSIGTQTLDVIAAYPEKFEVKALVCSKNISFLKEQIDRFHPQAVAVEDEEKAAHLRKQVKIPVLSGRDGVMQIAATKADITLNALVGIGGLEPTLAAIAAGNDIALANKETLVTGGSLVMQAAKDKGVNMLPVDSEHSAIWQCLKGDKQCKKIILTASGGAFRGYTREMLQNVTAAQALKHPTWNMGVKVTIDSATLMNKGFEVIEAMHLFNMPVEGIDVLIHKQSIVHSMVEFSDGSILAQLSYPDMKLPIQVALNYPERGDVKFSPLDLTAQPLTFEMPDLDVFPCLKIAMDCAKQGGAAPVILNAADEVLVDYFYRGLIKFYDVPYYICKAVDKLAARDFQLTPECIRETDARCREYLISCLPGR